ncbi:hypothetical protein BDD12DRAFT_876591 [Trichophaea hybrida]|nr:hypothetical protein BDD12DRAFT_876591 [Trichophaea hybrida]
MHNTDEPTLPPHPPPVKQTTNFAEDLYIFGEMNHFADLMALLGVAKGKHFCAAVFFKLLKTNTNGIDIVFCLNSPASNATTDFIEAVQCYLDQLLQDRINHTVAHLEISRSVFPHCREKMVVRYKKVIAAISSISVEELINHFPQKVKWRLLSVLPPSLAETTSFSG